MVFPQHFGDVHFPVHRSSLFFSVATQYSVMWVSCSLLISPMDFTTINGAVVINILILLMSSQEQVHLRSAIGGSGIKKANLAVTVMEIGREESV